MDDLARNRLVLHQKEYGLGYFVGLRNAFDGQRLRHSVQHLLPVVAEYGVPHGRVGITRRYGIEPDRSEVQRQYAGHLLGQVVRTEAWRDPTYAMRAAVT